MNTQATSVTTTLHKIYSSDGIELDAVLFEPKTSTDKIIIHTHGKEGHFLQNHFLTRMGQAYPEKGYAFMTYNNRGHDYIADLLKRTSSGYTWEQGGSVYDILENAQYDIQGVVEYARNLGFKEVILQGHSLGPHKICYYLVNNPNHGISKLIFLTTADVLYQFDSSVPDWDKWSLVAKQMVDKGQGKDLMPVRLWSNCPVSAATFWNYTNPNTNTFVFNGTHPDREYKNFNKVTLPMLVVNPGNDAATGVPQEQAVELIKKNSASAALETHIVPEAVHNFLGKEEELVGVISAWLQ